MKKYFAKTVFSGSLIMSLVLTSCGERLEILPQDRLTQEVAFSNETAALGVLTGAYSAAQQDDVLNGTFQLMSEWQSDNVEFVGSFPTFQDIRDYTTLSDNSSIFGVWDDNYEVIGTVNLVIANINNVDDPNFTQAERDNAIAQAKFLRALIYFNMSNNFGQPLQTGQGVDNLSVPLVLEPFVSEVKFPTRATLGEVHAQIEKDLIEAIPHLTNADNSRATKGAAQALLAKLYLFQEKFDSAIQYSNDVINSGDFTLATDYSFFNTQSKEFLFTLVNTTADGQDSNEGFSGLTNSVNNGGRGDCEFTTNLVEAFEEESGDKRFNDLHYVDGGKIYTSKFPDGQNNADNSPVLRITEVYLMRAEANYRNGSSIGDSPLSDINRLRSRAGLADLTAIDLDGILNERRKELCFEGQRRMDLLRNRKDLRRPGMSKIDESKLGENKTIFPIPIRETEINPNLIQNQGY